jgi:SpoIID/LytB domain protein
MHVYTVKKFITIFMSFLFILVLMIPIPVQARSIEDIKNEIAEKNQELEKIQSELETAEDKLENIKNEQSSASNEVEKIKLEIQAIDETLIVNEKKLSQLEKQKNLAKLEQEEFANYQEEQVLTTYENWKSGSHLNAYFSGQDMVKTSMYQHMINTKGFGTLSELETKLINLEEDYNSFLEQSNQLQNEIEELNERKAIAEMELNQIQQSAVAASNDLSELRTSSSNIQGQIAQLSKEQEEIQNLEESIIETTPGNDNNNGGNLPVIAGEIYFSGTGRDRYQGHGVGLSQYGALGAALNGWDYEKIVEFYFPGTDVKKINIPTSINVDGVGSVETEAYVSGLGEIPDNACEDLGVEFNPNNFWYCWPREVILAQVVVARTYGTRRAGFVYGDTRGQVYKGGTAKAWAAEATKGQVVTYNNSLADVYYSSDNSQGRGTADNDTVWSNYSGVGTVVPYLRSVDDSSFAYKSSWTNWGWRTNSYSITEINNLVAWSATSSNISSGVRSFMTGIKSDIGTLKSIDFERDNSGRIKRVVLVGDKGTRKMAGWLFKSIWNIWVGTVRPSGEVDYIYSLSFYPKQG